MMTEVISTTSIRRIIAASVHTVDLEKNGDVLLMLQMDYKVTLRQGQQVCKKFLQEILDTTCEYDVKSLQFVMKEDLDHAKGHVQSVVQCEHIYWLAGGL
jgi:hypothetical protein